MRTGRKWSLLLSAGLLILALIGFLIWPREPSYKGRSLGQWLQLRIHGGWEERETALEAIRHIGTNGLPCLLKRMEQKPPPWRSYLLDPGRNWIPGWIRVHESKQARRAYDACVAFEALGPAALPAIPRLAVLAGNPDRVLSQRGKYALMHIGPQAIPALVAALTNSDSSVRRAATNALNLVAPEVRAKAPGK